MMSVTYRFLQLDGRLFMRVTTPRFAAPKASADVCVSEFEVCPPEICAQGMAAMRQWGRSKVAEWRRRRLVVVSEQPATAPAR
jgi:hypothetical protein